MVSGPTKAVLIVAAGLPMLGCNQIAGIDDHALASSLPGQPGPADGAAALGPPGCFRGTPSTDTDFLNQCTNAQYAKFDNCSRLHLCSGEIPPLIDPTPSNPTAVADGGAPGSTPPSVGCYDAVLRNKLIFMQGSTNFTPFVQAMAPLVAKNGYGIVWQAVSSCAGAGAGGFDTDPGHNLLRNPTSSGQSYAAIYDQNGVAMPCLLGNSPVAPDGMSEITDIGESDVFSEGCPLPAGQAPWVPGGGVYADVAHYLGPIQAMVFVTPPGSTEQVISAEAARMVFGMGGNGGVSAPWIDPSRMLVRSSTTGTNNILSRAIDVPNSKWWGVDTKTASAMQTAILTASAADAERTVGTLSIDYADRVKSSLHILYFQAKGQLAGFLPDSSPSSSDKQNVRDGHYAAWGPIHLYTKLAGGQASAQAAAFIVPFNIPNQALVDATIVGGAVPVCAMHVSRDHEMGPLKAFSPQFQCNCYYDSKVNGGTHCPKCSGAADCPTTAPVCNLGYCETN